MTVNFKNNVYAWLLVAPFVLSLVVFFLFALVRSVAYSFTTYDLFNEPQWVGLNNYIALFSDPLFIRATINTFSFSFIVTMVQTTLALLLAVALNANIRGKSFFRTVFYIPSIMSSAAITLIFVWVYQKNGFLNTLIGTVIGSMSYISVFIVSALLTQLLLVLNARRKNYPAKAWDPVFAIFALLAGFFIAWLAGLVDLIQYSKTDVEISWLGTRDIIGPMPLTLWAIVLQNIFTTVPTLMLLFLAGLQNIPGDLYESAQVDGANKMQQLWHITVPQLAPITFVVVTMGIIGTLQMFDQVALLGGGVPLESRITLAFYVYHYAFPDGTSPQIGVASAAALALGLMTLLVVYIQKRFGIKEKANG